MATSAAYPQAFNFEGVGDGYYSSGLVLNKSGQSLTITTEGYPNGFLAIFDTNAPLLGRGCVGSQVNPVTLGGFNPLRFTFDTPLSSVTLSFGDGGGDNDSPVVVSAYDSSNTFLGSGTETYPADYAVGKQLSLNFNDMKYLILDSFGGAGNDHSLFWNVVSSTPVPEPSTFTLAGFGAAALAGARRRRYRLWYFGR
jgi:MYXO-CTERM domain-containing protein